MKIQSLLEVLDAAHLTHYIESPFPSRGAIMLVGPPGMMKTSILEASFNCHPAVCMLSDLNVNSLHALRDSLMGGRYSTLCFPEYEKLYMRKADTAANIEGTIKQLIEEGWTRASFQEQDAITSKTRAFVCGAMTYSFYDQHLGAWREGGFKRRCLWLGIKLRNPDRIMNAIRKWERIKLEGIPRKLPVQPIPLVVTEAESKILETYLKDQWEATPYILMKKILAVLRWKYGDKSKEPMRIMADFSECCAKQMGVIDL